MFSGLGFKGYLWVLQEFRKGIRKVLQGALNDVKRRAQRGFVEGSRSFIFRFRAYDPNSRTLLPGILNTLVTAVEGLCNV